MSPGLEPFRGRVLYDYLTRKQGARVTRQPGTSHISADLPNGRRVGMAPPSDQVTKSLMRQIAGQLDMTYPELRADMGYPIVERNKPRGKVERQERAVGKSTALATLNDLIDTAEIIKGLIYYGDRDPTTYARVHDAAYGALQELNHVRSTDALLRQVAALSAGSGT